MYYKKFKFLEKHVRDMSFDEIEKSISSLSLCFELKGEERKVRDFLNGLWHRIWEITKENERARKHFDLLESLSKDINNTYITLKAKGVINQ